MLAARIGQQNVKVASVITYKENRFVRYIFLSDHSDLGAADLQDYAECPLHQSQGSIVPGFFVDLTYETQDQIDRDAQDQI